MSKNGKDIKKALKELKKKKIPGATISTRDTATFTKKQLEALKEARKLLKSKRQAAARAFERAGWFLDQKTME